MFNVQFYDKEEDAAEHSVCLS